MFGDRIQCIVSHNDRSVQEKTSATSFTSLSSVSFGDCVSLAPPRPSPTGSVGSDADTEAHNVLGNVTLFTLILILYHILRYKSVTKTEGTENSVPSVSLFDRLEKDRRQVPESRGYVRCSSLSPIYEDTCAPYFEIGLWQKSVPTQIMPISCPLRAESTTALLEKAIEEDSAVRGRLYQRSALSARGGKRPSTGAHR